ncbi:drug resistance transporter, EmrB/QacA subfamily [Mycolicibacterium rutilum]|uniref:Drug resistance transporter, EmrB/QacA subfamily n=1 Tax=Mycolicibacterium rutilum TaxID=370526 RepID=A0A1H6IDF0_MYCRU|nr:MFS transporter [Mycolicibacterium rutilum]SEH45871.1 drug resistance transporter, EmrB/QacA subfamily [Mycolicibacterium rutilum]
MDPGAVALALFCVQIDYFAMNLALPRIAAEFDQTATDLQWLISAYMLALGAFMVPAGRIGDIFGRRRALLTGVALFGLASVACAVAPSVVSLIVFRVVQGLGAALIFPVSVSVLTNTYDTAKAGHAIGTAYGIAALGNAAGPLIGGLLTDTVGWRWIFWLNVPITLASLVIAARTVNESFDESAPRRIDISGLALISIGIGLFTLTFDRAPTWGWLSAWTVIAFTGSLVALAVFVVVENRVRWPLVDLMLLRDPRFTLLVVAGTAANVAYAVAIFLSTLFLQQVRGMDPLLAGLAFLGPSAGAAIGGVLAGRLAVRQPPVVMGVTTVLAAVSLAALAVSGGWVGYLLALTACGSTLGLVYAFTTVATQAVVRPERAGEAAGVTLTVLVSMAGVGVAVASTVLEMLGRNGIEPADAVDLILGALAAALLAAGALVLWLARSETTESARSR